MKIFGNKNTSETVDERTELERKFEEAGRKVGKSTGKAAQKGVDAYRSVVSNFEESGAMDKVRNAGTKVSDFTEDAFQKVEGAIKEVVDSVSKKKPEKPIKKGSLN